MPNAGNDAPGADEYLIVASFRKATEREWGAGVPFSGDWGLAAVVRSEMEAQRLVTAPKAALNEPGVELCPWPSRNFPREHVVGMSRNRDAEARRFPELRELLEHTRYCAAELGIELLGERLQNESSHTSPAPKKRPIGYAGLAEPDVTQGA